MQLSNVDVTTGKTEKEVPRQPTDAAQGYEQSTANLQDFYPRKRKC